MKAFRVAAGIHVLHGAIALCLGVAGIVNGLAESHIPESDWMLFAALVTIGPAFAAWTLGASVRAAGESWRRWVLPRAAFGVLLLVGYAFAGVTAVGFAGIGGIGADYFVLVAIGMAWLAIPELLILNGAVQLSRRAVTNRRSRTWERGPGGSAAARRAHPSVKRAR